jgi:hypothetical protein
MISFNKTQKISLGGQNNKEGNGNKINRNSNHQSIYDNIHGNKNRISTSSKNLYNNINFFSTSTAKTPHKP